MAAQVWLREGDELVWHRLARRAGGQSWKTVCGWEMSVLRGYLWPQKVAEVGPAVAERCRDCVAGVITPATESGDADNLAASRDN